MDPLAYTILQVCLVILGSVLGFLLFFFALAWKMDQILKSMRLENVDYRELVRILEDLKIAKLKKVHPKYGDNLKYSLQQHFRHLFSEVEELKEAVKQNDKEKIIEELVDISNMCDLTYRKITKEQ